MSTKGICPVCGYDPGRDAEKYPALVRIRAQDRLFSSRETILVGQREWEMLNQRLARIEKALSMLCAGKEAPPVHPNPPVAPQQKPPLHPDPPVAVKQKPLTRPSLSAGKKNDECWEFSRDLKSIRPAYWRASLPPHIVVPSAWNGDTVRRLTADAFRCTGVQEVTVSEGIEEIGAWAFAECPALETVILPGSLSQLGVGCFARSPLLSRLSLPASWRKKEDALRKTGLSPECAVEYHD